MDERKNTSICIERICYDRIRDVYDAMDESCQRLYQESFLPSPHLSIEELGGWEAWFQTFNDGWATDREYVFQIVEVETDQILGMVFLNRVQRPYRMANLGYWVRNSRQGEGIATQAAKLAARYGFEKLGLQRLEIVIRKDNTASLKIAEKIGAVREGLLRNRLVLQGSSCDAYMHSLVPVDYGIEPVVFRKEQLSERIR